MAKLFLNDNADESCKSVDVVVGGSRHGASLVMSHESMICVSLATSDVCY
jgi:hypothetical protein